MLSPVHFRVFHEATHDKVTVKYDQSTKTFQIYNLNFELYSLLLQFDREGIVICLMQES